ncbi:MAG: histidine kinase [Lachnospiraceae bacterium]
MKSNKLTLNYFSRQNVSRQLRALFIFTILIPILIIGGIIYFYSYRQITKNYEHLSEAKAMQVRSVLVTTTLYLHEVYEDLAGDSTLRSLLATEYSTSAEALAALGQYTGFEDTLANTTALTSLALYVDSGLLKQDTPYTFFNPITELVQQEEWYKRAETTKGNFWMSNLRTSEVGVSYWELNYYCHIPIPKTTSWAVLVLTVSNDYLRNLIQEDNYDIYVSVNSDPVFFSTDRQYAGNAFPSALSSASSYYEETGQLTVSGTEAIASIQTLKPYASSDQIHILAAAPDALPNIVRLEFAFFLAAGFAVTISALLIFLYARYFSNRIQTLRLAMYKVSRNDYEIVNTIRGDDELTATFSDLKTMVQKLKETDAQIYEAQIKEQVLSNQQQQMELKLLANQINPHFLYNTLETIRMKAFSEGNKEVATAIKLLGKSMRYVLNNTKTTATTLDKELAYIKTYLSIQQMRFGNRLNYSIRMDDTFSPEEFKILPLLIQPVVENAITHGLESTGRKGHIILKFHNTEENLLIVDIFDNGIGMSAEQLQEALCHLDIPEPNSEHGVGLYNINNRVRLFYGTQYGLTIKSRPGMGTLVTLTVPQLNLTEEKS